MILIGVETLSWCTCLLDCIRTSLHKHKIHVINPLKSNMCIYTGQTRSSCYLIQHHTYTISSPSAHLHICLRPLNKDGPAKDCRHSQRDAGTYQPRPRNGNLLPLPSLFPYWSIGLALRRALIRHRQTQGIPGRHTLSMAVHQRRFFLKPITRARRLCQDDKMIHG